LSDDFLQFEGFQAEISAMIDSLNHSVRIVDETAAQAVDEAAQLIADEQRRLLGKASFKRDRQSHDYNNISGDLIRIFRDKRSRGIVYKVRIGYDAETLKRYPELYVIEFGRPGKSPRHSKPKDKLGRKKGEFPAHISHIRAGFFTKKEEAAKRVLEKLYEAAAQRFGG